MRDFYEHTLHEEFRQITEVDRQLERCGWFRRHEHRPPKIGWRFRAGEALIRLGCWVQGQGGTYPARSSGKI